MAPGVVSVGCGTGESLHPRRTSSWSAPEGTGLNTTTLEFETLESKLSLDLTKRTIQNPGPLSPGAARCCGVIPSAEPGSTFALMLAMASEKGLHKGSLQGPYQYAAQMHGAWLQDRTLRATLILFSRSLSVFPKQEMYAAWVTPSTPQPLDAKLLD